MNFLVFSDDWGVHPSSCQHIFKVLHRAHPTLWVNTIGMRPPRISLEDLTKAARKIRTMLASRPRPVAATPASGPAVCAPFMSPFRRPRWLAQWSARSVLGAVSERMARLGLADACAVTTVPNVDDVVGRLGARKVIYYCVDDFSEWPGLDRSKILDMEKKLLRSVTAVICTSQALLERFRNDFPTTLLTHGVDIDLFSSEAPAEHELLRGIPEPRVGYFGLFDGRSDSELLEAVARALPDVSFVITGPTEGDVGALRGIANICFTGPVPYAELPSILRGWKACILPYRMNELTEKINPLKLKEYLASGKPVIATGLPEARKLAPYLRIADSREAWVEHIREAISGAWMPDRRSTLDYLRPHAWERKAEEFLRICEAA